MTDHLYKEELSEDDVLYYAAIAIVADKVGSIIASTHPDVKDAEEHGTQDDVEQAIAKARRDHEARVREMFGDPYARIEQELKGKVEMVRNNFVRLMEEDQASK